MWPKGQPRSAETRARISSALVAAHTEGRHSPERKARHVEEIRRWQLHNPEKTAAWKLKGQQRVRRRLIEALGGRCVQCGFSDWRALQVDHVNGDGRKDPHRYGSRYAYSKIVLANRDRYQLLCANCNWIKRYECGEHGRTED